MRAPRGQRQHASKIRNTSVLQPRKKTSFCPSLHIYARGSFGTWQTGYDCQSNLLKLSFNLIYVKIDFHLNLWEGNKVPEFKSSKQEKPLEIKNLSTITNLLKYFPNSYFTANYLLNILILKEKMPFCHLVQYNCSILIHLQERNLFPKRTFHVRAHIQISYSVITVLVMIQR